MSDTGQECRGEDSPPVKAKGMIIAVWESLLSDKVETTLPTI